MPGTGSSEDARLLSALDALPETNPGSNELCRLGKAKLIPFPAFTKSGLKDYMGRSVQESLDAVRSLTGLKLPIVESCKENALGRSFWKALIRGGYQGAVYYLDSIGSGND